MSQINLNNYEAYLLDFSEGKLSDELQLELELFLIQYPELDVNLNDFELVTLDSEKRNFVNKSHLKKSNSDLISETQFINYIENLASEADRRHLEKSCSLNPQLKTELGLYASTIFQPDHQILFDKKTSLKRKPKVIWFNLSPVQFAAAASVILILGLVFFLYRSNTVYTKPLMAKNSIQKSADSNHLPVSTQSVELAESYTNVSSNKSNKKPDNIIENLTHTKHSKGLADPNNIPEPITLANTVPNEIEKEQIITQKNEPLNQPHTFVSVPKKSVNNTTVDIISDPQDDMLAENTDKKKKGIWAMAGKALKNLNHLGVKSVNGEEESTENNTAYALTIGGLNITHTTGSNL